MNFLLFSVSQVRKFSSFLQNNERSITDHHPKRQHEAPQWIEHSFYPPNKGRVFAIADKIIFAAVIFSIFSVFVEGKLDADFPGYQLHLSIIFLCIFLADLAFRCYLKGKRYFLWWGVVDIIAMLGDIFVILMFMFPNIFPESELAMLFKLLRGLRLLRLVKFTAYLSIFKRVFVRFWLYIKAFFKIFITLSIFAFAPAAIFYAFFDLSLKDLWSFLVPLLSIFKNFINPEDIIKPANCINEFSNAINIGLAKANFVVAEGKFVSGKICGELQLDRSIAYIYQLLIIIFGFAATNIILMFFVPAMKKITENTREDVIQNTLKNHHIIYVDKDHDLLEELIYVFENYSQKQVLYLLNDEEKMETQFPKNALIRRGKLNSRAAWLNANAAEAESIVLFNTEDLEIETIVYTFFKSGRQSKKLPQFLLINDDCNHECTNFSFGAISVSQAKISINELRRKLEGNIYNFESIQYAFYTNLIDHLDEKFVFPLNHKTEDFNINLEGIGLGKNKLSEQDAKIEVKNNNLLIMPPDDKVNNKPDSYRVFLIKKLVEEHEEVAKKINIFCFVNDFYLFDHNSEFSKKEDLFVNIFAIEFAIALSIFHELNCQGISKYWNLSNDKLEEGAQDSEDRHWGHYWKRKELDVGRKAAYIIKNNKQIICFFDEDHRILIEQGDKIVFID